MKSIRRSIEQLFEQLGRIVYRNRIKTVLLMLLLSFPIIMQLPKITIDTANESYFHKDGDALVDYNNFRDQYGKDELFIVAINPPDVFDLKFLRKLKALQEELKARVPYLDDITSLINARNTRGEGDMLIVEDLMEEWPENEERLDVLRERALSNPLYVNNLISEDGAFTAIILKAQTYAAEDSEDIMDGFEDDSEPLHEETSTQKYYLSNEQNIEIVDAITPILKKYESPDFRIYFAGAPAVVAALDRGIRKTLITFTPISLLIVAVFLFIMFRRISGVVYPFLIIVLSLLTTMGFMAVMRIPITNVTQILPTFLVVVGVGDAVHILAVFYLRYKETMDREESIAYALGHSGLAVLMTSLTTAMGLLSFVGADVAAIEDLGIAAPIGVMLALIYTIVLLPALLALFPVKRHLGKDSKSLLMDGILSRIAGISYGHPLKIIFISCALVVLSIVGITNIAFSHNGLKWLPQDLPVRKATEILDEKLKGTLTLEVVIDTGRENGLYDPGILNRLDTSVKYAENLDEGEVYVGKAWTLTAILKEINMALNGNNPEFYSIPRNRDLIAQEFLLFEGSGSDDLEEIVDTEFRKARFTIKAPFRDAVQYKEKLIDSVRKHFRENYPDADIKITGVISLFIAMIHNLIMTMAKSYAVALSIITVLMMLLIGRVRIGMLSMVPNLVPILLVLGAMGWRDIPMDLSNILVGSVAIGLVVDDTIHFMHNFRRYFEETGSAKKAVSMTLHTTGRAILVTSIVLSLGFYVLMFAEMKNTYYFGLLTGSSVVLALIADFFLAPALMTLVYGHKRRKPFIHKF